LESEDARLLACEPGHPALLSIRTSINQFGQPFLYDEALLVGGRSVIEADRTTDRLSLSFDHVEV
jgi:DNA-binding GntR family transcriptional regulator